MSTKSTILLSKDNEHWYEEGIDGSIVLEIERKHIEYMNEDDIIYCIKQGTPLHRAISIDVLGLKVCKGCGHAYGKQYSKQCPCGSTDGFYTDAIEPLTEGEGGGGK